MGITPHSLNHTAHYLSKLQPGQCLPRIEPPHPVLVFSTLNEARRNRLFHVVKRIGHWSSLTIPGQGNVRKGRGVYRTHITGVQTGLKNGNLGKLRPGDGVSGAKVVLTIAAHDPQLRHALHRRGDFAGGRCIQEPPLIAQEVCDGDQLKTPVPKTGDDAGKASNVCGADRCSNTMDPFCTLESTRLLMVEAETPVQSEAPTSHSTT